MFEINVTAIVVGAVWLIGTLVMYRWIDKNWNTPMSQIPGIEFREKDAKRWLEENQYKGTRKVTVGDVFTYSCGAKWYSLALSCLVTWPIGLLFLFLAKPPWPSKGSE